MVVEYLKDVGPSLAEQGYHVLPLAPGKKYPLIEDWPNVEATVQEVRKWANNGYRSSGVGILCGNVIGVDIDILDKEISKKVIDWCILNLGQAPQRVGLAPKTLFVFRTEVPFGKINSSIYTDFFEDVHKIEILGKGQQFVAYAKHPDTGRSYIWINGPGISDIPFDELPVITQRQASELVKYFESIVPAEWQLKSNGQSGSLVSKHRGSFDHNSLEYLKPKANKTTEQIEEILEEIRFVADESGQYENWKDVGMGLWHQYDGSEEGFDLWNNWSAGGFEYEKCEKKMRSKWRSFKPTTPNYKTFATVLGLRNNHVAKTPIQDLKSNDQKFKILHATDVLAKLGPIDWQIEDFLEKDSTGLIFGEPGSFKSFIALDMGFHVAAGKDWHGRKVQQGPAIYLAGEGHNGLARRLAAWSTHHGVQFDDLPFYISETAASLCDKLSVIDVAAAVKSIADQKGDPSMIIIDTLARNFGPGDENSTTDMSTFIDHVDSVLRHEFGATVCLVHHSGHSNKERARGSAALKAGLDFEYRVEKIKGSLTVGFTNTKMKNAPEHTEATWFEGKEVFFGDFEDNISSLVFEMTEAPVTEEKPLKGKQAKLFELIFREGPVERETLRNITIEEGVFDNSDQFKRAVQELKKKDRIKEIDNKFSILDEFFEDGHGPDTGGHF